MSLSLEDECIHKFNVKLPGKLGIHVNSLPTVFGGAPYISGFEASSTVRQSGVIYGDVLLAVNGISVLEHRELEDKISGLNGGASVLSATRILIKACAAAERLALSSSSSDTANVVQYLTLLIYRPMPSLRQYLKDPVSNIVPTSVLSSDTTSLIVQKALQPRSLFGPSFTTQT